MELLTYLPIIVGVSLFFITLFLRSRGKTPAKGDALSPTSAKSAKGKAGQDIKSPGLNGAIEEVIPKYGPIHIYFGSQTGAANNFANVLSEEAARAGFEPKVVDLADFTPEFFQGVRLALFAMSTHGEGDPTENAKTFNEFIMSTERTGQEFKGLKYAVFALGNKQYQFYCAQGRRTDQGLARLGGERVYKYGEGDDNENLEDDFNTWKEGIWAELVKISEAAVPEPTALSRKTSLVKNSLPFVVRFNQDLKEIDLDNYDAAHDGKEYDFQAKKYLHSATAKLSNIRELRQKTDDGSTLHVEIDCASVGLTYKTAQNLGVYPENSSEVVNKAAGLLHFNLNDVFSLEQNPEIEGRGTFKHPIPSPISIETYLTKFCDLESAVKKKQLKDLAQFCPNKDNKNRLLFLASNEGKTEYEVQIQSRMKGLIDLIEEFDVKLTLENLIHVSSVILPRDYTIASSSRKHPDTVHLCVSINADSLPDGKEKVGLTSGFFTRQFEQLKQGKSLGKARINVKESTFALPTDANTPIIMVGPGAGIAPFKGFADEKAYLARAGGDNPYGEMTLYFGCKGSNWDYLYKDELTQYHADGLLKNFYTAFSREQNQKVYVQDLIGKNKDEMSQLLFEGNAVFYMCGSMAMGKSVLSKLAELAASHYKLDLKEAHSKIEELEKNKKIIKELWG